MRKCEVSIVIVNYKSFDLLADCITSIYKKTSGVNYEIIIVNNSPEESKSIKGKFPDVSLIINKENLGFAKAVNQGIKVAEGNYYFLLNPDTRLKNNAIKTLLNFAKKQKMLGAVGAMLLNPNGTPQPSCFNLPTIKNAILEYWFGKKGKYDKFLPSSDQPIKVEATVGAAILIPRSSIEKIGLFDEIFFMYYEDLEWCKRAKKYGFDIYWNPDAKVIHVHGASAGKNPGLAYKRLVQSSKIYHGVVNYWVISFVIKLRSLFSSTPSFKAELK